VWKSICTPPPAPKRLIYTFNEQLFWTNRKSIPNTVPTCVGCLLGGRKFKLLKNNIKFPCLNPQLASGSVLIDKPYKRVNRKNEDFFNLLAVG
jgi:hypothetical protein